MKYRENILFRILPWVLLVGFSLVWNFASLRESHRNMVLSVGRAFFTEIETARDWNSQHGGVYVPVTETSVPNPYLKVPERDVETKDGRKLTMINPAYMTRQIGEILARREGVQYHITSLNPIRPENGADPWEARALASFEKGVGEILEHRTEEGVYRYMAPLLVRESCLKCHGEQGYKPGDIRGGISVSIPDEPHLATIGKTTFNLSAVHLIVLITGCLGTVLFHRFRLRQLHLLSEKNAALLAEVGQRKKTEARLEQAILEAETASRTKSMFLSNMSHEVRTPMNGIIGMTELLKQTELSEEQRNYLELLGASAGSLLAMMEDVLDFARLETGNCFVEKQPMSIEDLFRDAGKRGEALAREKGLDFHLRLDARLSGIFLGDPVKIKHVLMNLLGNAVKFTHRGEIGLDCAYLTESERTLKFRVVVSDTGIGVSEKDRDLIFRPFSQLDPSLTRKYGGVGIGLAVSGRLLALMGGTLDFESEPGKGSRFRFELEVEKPETP